MKYKALLLIIFSLALFLRIYNVAKIPPGLSNDEVSIAFNAYAIGQTGKDEYGTGYPISFRSHNTFKAPLYIYVTAPVVGILGNTEMTTRLPSVLFGSLTVVIVGLIAYELTKSRKVSLWSAFLLAIAPWHIYTSRIALESNVALFFLVLGVYLFLLGVRKNIKLVYLSVISFVLSMYGYHTQWIFTPLLMVTMLLIYKDKLIAHKKTIIISAILFVLMIGPLFIDAYINSQETTRASTEFLNNDSFLLSELGKTDNKYIKLLVSIRFWQDRYLNYLNPAYIFVTGLPILNIFGSQKIGLLYVWLLPLFVIGFWGINKYKSDTKKLIVAWLLLGILVPSLTLGDLNLVRNLVSIVPIIILISIGIVHLCNKIKYPKMVNIVVLLFGFISTLLFFHYYFVHFPKQLSENWSYGFRQMAGYLGENAERYEKVIIDPNYGTQRNDLVGIPHLFILYFNEHKVDEYLANNINKEGSLTFSNYEIRKVDWPKESPEDNSLYIVGIHSTPLLEQNLEEIHSINLINGSKAFKFYEN